MDLDTKKGAHKMNPFGHYPKSDELDLAGFVFQLFFSAELAFRGDLHDGSVSRWEVKHVMPRACRDAREKRKPTHTAECTRMQSTSR